MIKHITCSTDDYYVQHCMAMLCSLFENNIESKFHVHLLMDKLSQQSCDYLKQLCKRYKNEIFFYQIDGNSMEGIPLSELQFNGRPAYSIATYYRMLLPSIIPTEVNQILYLDCDIIVLGKVDELFSLNLKGYGLAAVSDCSPFDSYHRFKMGLGLNNTAFCAGMMMINLDYWRKNNSQTELMEYALRDWKAVYMQDQDALNYVFRDSWYQLPYKWGKTPLSVAPVDERQRWFDIEEYVFCPQIIHYSAHVKPWLNVWFPERKFYWEYVALSGYPNPQIIHTTQDVKKRIYISLARYYINKYVRPFIPNIIEQLIKDCINIVLCLLYLFRKKRMRMHILKLWYLKYHIY